MFFCQSSIHHDLENLMFKKNRKRFWLCGKEPKERKWFCKLNDLNYFNYGYALNSDTELWRTVQFTIAWMGPFWREYHKNYKKIDKTYMYHIILGGYFQIFLLWLFFF